MAEKPELKVAYFIVTSKVLALTTETGAEESTKKHSFCPSIDEQGSSGLSDVIEKASASKWLLVTIIESKTQF